MSGLHSAYLALLDEVSVELGQLIELAQQKTAAVRKDDLAALDEILKKEQAKSLTLRGLEQKRLKLLEQLSLTGVPLGELATHYPQELQVQAKKTSETLRRQYQFYQSAAQVARNTLECNLHQIEKFLGDAGSSVLPGPGYDRPRTEPPPSMKTDFRA